MGVEVDECEVSVTETTHWVVLCPDKRVS